MKNELEDKIDDYLYELVRDGRIEQITKSAWEMSKDIRKLISDRDKEYDKIFKWLLGEGDSDFRQGEPNEGKYYWRKELRKKLDDIKDILEKK